MKILSRLTENCHINIWWKCYVSTVISFRVSPKKLNRFYQKLILLKNVRCTLIFFPRRFWKLLKLKTGSLMHHLDSLTRQKRCWSWKSKHYGHKKAHHRKINKKKILKILSKKIIGRYLLYLIALYPIHGCNIIQRYCMNIYVAYASYNLYMYNIVYLWL